MAFLDDALSTLNDVAGLAERGVNIYSALRGSGDGTSQTIVQPPPPPAPMKLGPILAIVGIGLVVTIVGFVAFKALA